MIIGIDGNEANVTQRVGIGQYAFQVLWHLKRFQRKNIVFKIYLKDRPREDMPEENEWWRYEVFGPKKFWTQFALPLKLYREKEKPDVFFSPSHYVPRWCPCPGVISIMDLSYLHFPKLFTKKDLFQLRNWTRHSVEHAEKICTISEYSKQDIVRSYGVPDDRVVVTYPGYDKKNFIPIESGSNFKSSNAVGKKYGISEHYILFVGTVQPRKNIVRLVEAFEKIKSMKKSVETQDLASLQLVIVGKKGWLWEEIIARIEKSPVRKDILFPNFVSDEDLPDLYRNARCFVLPSLYEGFGIPVIEAMACGCPVVASSVSSLPEIVGDAGILIDPLNTDDMVDAILEAGYDEKRRELLIKKGLENVKQFSWETCAKTVLEVLQTTAHHER